MYGWLDYTVKYRSLVPEFLWPRAWIGVTLCFAPTPAVAVFLNSSSASSSTLMTTRSNRKHTQTHAGSNQVRRWSGRMGSDMFEGLRDKDISIRP